MPDYTKRHYEMVAKVIRDIRHDLGGDDPVTTLTTVLAIVTTRFAEKFQADNTRFDVERFITATFPPQPKELQ